jgi:uncharacterized protein YndB with AHSA1/START domain
MDRVSRTVELDAPVDRVWAALIEADRLAAWMGARVTIDARPGGLVSVADEDGERRGTVELVDPGRRLALRLWRMPPAGEGLDGSRIDFSVDDVGSSTRLTVVETRLSSPDRVPDGPGEWSIDLMAGAAGRG